MIVSDELKRLAATLADWAADAPACTVYLFGSRVRGDSNPGSDVDLHLHLSNPADEASFGWLVLNQTDDFVDIKPKLPGPLGVLDPHNLQLCEAVRAAPVVHCDRNVRCVWLPRQE